MSVSPSVQAIICEEVFDESSHPSVEEVNEYAEKIGIDPASEPHLLHLAKEGLMQALPADWKPCFDEKSKSYYYYHGGTGRTQWEHPLDNMYRSLVLKVRSGSQASASFEEDSKGHEDHTYTKEDLQSYEESLSKPVTLGAKSMQDFATTSSPFAKKIRTTNMYADEFTDKITDNKSFLSKNDKHPNTIDKGELKLSGGGSMFLKSNTKKITQDSNSQDAATDKSVDAEYLPKSILRDRSLPESHSFKDFSFKEVEEKRRQDSDDVGKSVRFNLEMADQEIEFTFSDSEQKSTSDEEIEVFAERRIKKEVTPVLKSRFTVSPVKFDEFGPQSIKPKLEKAESIFDKIENAEKEEQSSPRNSNLKLIKPNPTDFITPKLIGKPLDVVKPISLHSDSEEDSINKYKAKFPNEHSIISEKVSNVQDSIPEEVNDRSYEISFEEKIDIVDNDTVPIPETQMAVEQKKRDKIKIEMEESLMKYKKELTHANETEIDNFKQGLLEDKLQQIEILKQSIRQSQELEIEDILVKEKQKQDEYVKSEIEKLKTEMEKKYKTALEDEESRFHSKLAKKKVEMETQYNQTLEQIEKSFRDKEKEIENNFQMSLKQAETDFLLKLEERIKEISADHKTMLDRMKDNHELAVEELVRDFKSEEEIIRKEHIQNLADLKEKLLQELENEKHRMRELGEDRLYEKVRCEKRLLEDKYRCLKEKYLRLKTDVKVSLEKRNRRKEQSLTTTTGSDTERSTSHKKGSNSERVNINSSEINKKKSERHPSTPKHLSKSNRSDVNINRSKAENKHTQQIIIEDLDTSISDRSSKKNDNDNKKENDFDSSDGVSNPGRSRRKMFTRLKSSSTSRLNNNSKCKEMKRSCSPVENLRRQLQKLEDLEDQFPQTAPSDTYHLRYPFSDAVPGDIAGSSELEFFRHRIHLERDSVRRAKESLRTQRTNFQKRQRELKVRHGSAARNTLQQLFQEERELSDMEVSLHRTRSLLGEKVIRLRHLEQSLQRIAVTKKQDDATLSDLSSHSASSGISSTATDTNTNTNIALNGKCRTNALQESSHIMHSLENLNSEIRDIWDVLNKQQHAANVTTVMPSVPVYAAGASVALPTLNAIPTLADRLDEYHQRLRVASVVNGAGSGGGLASHVVVTHGATATTTLVERTKNLRDWLRQAKAADQATTTTTTTTTTTATAADLTNVQATL